MDPKNLLRLKELASKRNDAMRAIQQFDDLFFNFARYQLKTVVQQINLELEKSTGDNLKIFYDDPYEIRRNQFYALVQLFIGNSKYEFFLDSTRNNPSIKFEGLEFNGKVKVTLKLQNEEKFKDFKEYQIDQINDIIIEELIIGFIEKVYNR